MLVTYIAILLIPVILIEAVNFTVMRRQNYDILEGNIRASSERQLSYLNSQFQVLTTAAAQMRKDKNMYYRYRSNDPGAFWNVHEVLEKTSVWSTFFSDIFYYDREDKIIISNRGRESEDFFTENIITMEDIDKTDGFVNGLGLLKGRDLKAGGNACILVAAPMEKIYSKQGVKARSLILFQVPCERFENVLAPDGLEGNDYRIVVSYNGQMVGTNSSELYEKMYAGEEVRLNAGDGYYYSFSDELFQIEWSIPKNLYNASLVSLVLGQALVVFLVLAIGVAAIYWFTQRSYQPLKSILQNIPDKYSSDSVKFADEFKYIDFVLNDLLYSQSIFKESRDQLRQEQYLYYIVDNQVQKGSALYKQCLEEGIRLDRQRFLCVLVEDVMENSDVYQYFNEGFLRYREHSDIYSLYIMGDKYVFLICSDLEQDALLKMIHTDLKKCGQVQVGFGQVVEELDRIRFSYNEARGALDKPFPDGIKKIYPQTEIDALSEAIEAGNTAKVEFAIRMMKGDLPYLNPVIGTTVLVDVAALLNGGDRVAAMQSLKNLDTITPETVGAKLDEQLALYIQNQAEESEPEKPARRQNLKEVVKYVEENYTSPDFSVKGMAAEFNTSASNLSHYFKNSTGQTISQYVEEMRMQKAKELLLSGHKVGETVELLGYGSAASFTAAFKRYYAMTPQAFRAKGRASSGPAEDDGQAE